MKAKACYTIIILFCILKNEVNAQSQQKAFVGIGLGLDYGGIGIRAELQPIKNIGIIGGIGYNVADPAYNVGLSFKVLPDKKITPVVMAMYGYNAVVKIKNPYGNIFYSKSYYGPSIGAGCELYNRSGKNKWTFEMFVPFRSSEFHDKHDELKAEGFKFHPDVLPVTLTVGYNFSINKSKNQSHRHK